jgi:hypothetical protein
LTCPFIGTARIAAFIGSPTWRSSWLSTGGGMVHTHQSALLVPVWPVTVSVQLAVTPAPSCASRVTRVLSRTLSPTWRMNPAAIRSIPPFGWNIVVCIT